MSGRDHLVGLNAILFFSIKIFLFFILTNKGTIIAVLGKGTDSGDFEVEDYVLPGYCPQKPFPSLSITLL
jgi:hypothetical protein